MIQVLEIVFGGFDTQREEWFAIGFVIMTLLFLWAMILCGKREKTIEKMWVEFNGERMRGELYGKE